MPGIANDLNINQTGFQTFNSSTGVFNGRTLTAGTGINITNGNGQAGDPVISFSGGGVDVEHLTGDTGGQLNPTANNFNLLSSVVVAGTTPLVIAGSGSTLTTTIQRSQAIAATDATKIGLSNFNSAQFTVDANGFVSTSGTGVLNTLTGNSGGTISPTAGNINTLGTGSITIAGSGSTLTTQLTGLTNHAVLVGAGTATITNLAIGTNGQVLTGVTGSDPVWALPATSGTVTSVSVVSANGFAGTVATATTTPAITLSTTITGVLSGNGTAITGSAVTQYDVLIGGASNAISSVGPGSSGQVLQSGGNAANPAYSTATYPATATGTGKILRADGTNWVATTATYPNTAGTTGNVLTSDGTNWTSAAAPTGTVLSQSFTLTNAQIKALHGTPISVIPAPGAGKVNYVIGAVTKLNYGGSNAFTAGVGQTISLIYTSGSGFSLGVIMANSTLVATTSSYGSSASNVGAFNGAITNFENQAIFLYNSQATEITGNAAANNTITGVIYYVTTNI